MKRSILMFCTFLAALTVFGQKDSVFTIDLGKEREVEYNVRLDKNFRVQIRNTVPSRDYSISYKFEKVENTNNIGEVILAKVMGGSYSSYKMTSKSIGEEGYDNIYDYMKSILDTLTYEYQISEFAKKVDKTVMESTDITPEVAEKINSLKQSLNKDYDKVFKINKPDEVLVMTITRTDDSEDTWTMTIKPEKVGEFQVTYGFSVISPCLNAYDNYYSKYIGNDEFQIVSKGKPEWNEFIYNPMVTLTWYRNKPNSYYGISTFNPTVGFGLAIGSDVLNPSIFAGFSFSVQRIINLSVGMAMHQFMALSDEIDLSQTYTDFLSKDMIQTKSVYVFNPAFGITFNLGQNSSSE